MKNLILAAALAIAEDIETQSKTRRVNPFKWQLFDPIPPCHENGTRINLNTGKQHNTRNSRKTKGKKK